MDMDTIKHYTNTIIKLNIQLKNLIKTIMINLTSKKHGKLFLIFVNLLNYINN